MKKKALLATILSAVMICFVLGISGIASSDEEILNWTNANALPTSSVAAGKTVVLMTDVTVSAPANYGAATANAPVVIDLNGHTITSTGVSSGAGVFVITAGGKLTLRDSSALKTGNIKGPDTQNRVVYIYGSKAGTTFTLDGANISGNKVKNGVVATATSSSADVSGAVFNMTGGSISGNTASSDGGAVYIGTAGNVFNMTGGVISGNTSAGNGGAIFAAAGKLSVSGGEISANNSSKNGGAIRINAGELSVSDALISENTASEGTLWIQSDIDVSIENSSIINNEVSAHGSAMVFNNNGATSGYTGTGTLTMKNVDIRENTSSSASGEAVYFNTGTLVLSGKTVIKDNLCGGTEIDVKVSSGKTVTVGAQGLDEESSIGLYFPTDPAEGAAIVTGASREDEEYFFVTKPAEIRLAYESGALKGTYVEASEEYLPWDLTDSLPTAGKYYLNCDVTVSSRTRLTADLELNLNGYTITAGSGSFYGILGISANNDYLLHVFNDKNTGGFDGNNLARTGFLLGSVTNSRGEIRLENVSIWGVKGSSGSSGACICLQGQTDLFMTDCTINGVECGGDGGAIYTTSTGNITLDSCTFTNNTAQGRGGALFLNGAGTTLVRNCTITGNTCAGTGGGIGAFKGEISLAGVDIIKNNTAADETSNLYFTESTVPSAKGLSLESEVGLYYGSVYEDGTALVKDVATEAADSFFADNIPSDSYLKYNAETETLCSCLLPSGELVSAQIAADEDLTVYIYASYKRSLADRVILEVTMNGQTTELSGSFVEAGENYGYYRFVFDGVCVKQMTDEISFRLLFRENGNETELDLENAWTVRGYADSLKIAYEDKPELVRLLADLLEYGAEAQLYTGYNTSDLANDLTWVAGAKTGQYTAANSSVMSLSAATDSGKRFTSATLRVGRDIKIIVYMTLDDTEGITVSAFKNGTAAGETSVIAADGDAQSLYLFTVAVSPSEFDDVWTFRLTQDGEVLQQLSYSVNSYLTRKQNSSVGRSFIRSIYNYYVSAMAYMQASRITHDLTATEFHVGNGYEWTSFTQCLIDLQGIETEKTIYVHEGTYDIFREYRVAGVTRPAEDFPRANTADYMPYNIIVPTNTHIIGVDDDNDGEYAVVLKYAPSAEETYAAESWLVSPLNVSGSATIENIEVRCKNGRYTIHDETLGLEEYSGATKTYINVKSYKEKNDEGLGFGSGIGFGFDDKMTFTFTDCEFYNENSSRPFYMHSRKQSKEGRIYGEADSSTITLNNCIIQSPNSNTSAMFFGNATGITSEQHIVVTMNDCRIKGAIKTANEADNSLGTNSNRFDFRLNRCSAVTINILDPNNTFIPIITDPAEAWN